jgi:heat shock protein HslJ
MRWAVSALAIPVMLAGSLFGCAARDALGGRSLNSIQVTDDGQPMLLVPSGNGAASTPAHLSLTFFDNGAFGSSGGCNYFMGESYSIDQGMLRVRGGDSGTAIGCGIPLMNQDEWFAKFVQSGPKVTFADETVILSGTGVATVYLGDSPIQFDATGIVITMVDGTWP